MTGQSNDTPRVRDTPADFAERRDDVLLFRLGGAPAKSAAAWLSAIDRAEREGRPCPGWAELEAIAPSVGAD